MCLSWPVKNITGLLFGLFIMISHWAVSTGSHSKHLQLACSTTGTAFCQDLGEAQCSISYISIDHLIDCCVSMFITQSVKGLVQWSSYKVLIKPNSSPGSLGKREQFTFAEKVLEANQKLKWWSLEEEIWISELPLGLTHGLALWKQKKNSLLTKNFQT